MGFTNQIEKALLDEAGTRRQVIAVNIELLPACNLRCKMCYIRTDMRQVNACGGLRPVEEWLKLAKQMRDAGVLFMILTGGEVFLYPQFKELYLALYKMGFMITINSNGTLIDEEAVSWLREYPPKCVSLSLYGASNATYEAICGQKGVFDRVDHAIRLLKENKIPLELKTILTPLNIHDAEACWQYANELGILYLTSTYTFPPTRKASNEDVIRLNPHDAVQARFESNRRISGEAAYREKIIEHLQRYEDTRRNPGQELYGFTCGATRNSCWITWQGRMTPCAMLDMIYTMPFDAGFLPAWEELKIRCDQILMSTKCSHCDKRAVCSTCPAANFAETGHFDCAAPFHCEMTEYTLDRMYDFVKEWGMEDRIMCRGEEM